MAADIIPIKLSLTASDGVTLWAPHWVEDGEDWEAFLGHGDALYVLPDAAHLAAFIRSTDEHDLADHPAWEQARHALADELVPGEDHHFDIIGVPELVTSAPDTWALAELADTIAILHSLAEVCGLNIVEEVLDSSAGFALVPDGPRAFASRSGKKLWREMCGVIADRWDAVVDALDEIVVTPKVDEATLSTAEGELKAVNAAQHEPPEAMRGEPEPSAQADDDSATDNDATDGTTGDERDPDLEFWDEVGIDCISITSGGRMGWSLRCYLDDAPVFLSVDGKVQLYRSPAALEEYLADESATNALSALDAWTTIREAIDGGEASVIAAPENAYELDGLAEKLLDGPDAVDGRALGLAVELLADAGQARGDSEVAEALSTATPLGNLLRAAMDPDPGRMPPSPPFDDEAAAFRALIEKFQASLAWR